MNALSASLTSLSNPQALEQFLQDMGRWSFDIACIKISAHDFCNACEQIDELLASVAKKASSLSLSTCAALDISHAPTQIGLSEAQHDSNNRPIVLTRDIFLASFASSPWKEHLEEILRSVVREHGIKFVRFGPPIWRADIPGVSDPLYKVFHQTYPNTEYPDAPAESAGYLSMQALKGRVAVEFCSELAQYAKHLGADIVGITTLPFVPTPRSMPMDRSVDSWQLTAIPAVDFAAVQLRPDIVSSVAAEIGENSDTQHHLHYAEVLAAATGKPVVVVTPNEDHFQWPPVSPVDARTLLRSTLAAVSAAPNGIVADWETMRREDGHQKLVTTAAQVLPRMVHQRTRIAFVVSASSARHASPLHYADMWQRYWALMGRMLSDVRRQALTFSADTIEDNLRRNPNLRMLILEEHFPLTESQVGTLLQWWRAEPGRSLVIFGSGTGLSASPSTPGEVSIDKAFPGLLDQIGLHVEGPSSIPQGDSGTVSLLLRGSRQIALPEDGAVVRAPAVANVRRVFGSGCTVLYTNADGHPIITRWRTGDTIAYFCGIDSSAETAPLLTSVIRQAATNTFRPPMPSVIGHSGKFLWNGTSDGYLIVGNFSDEPASVTLARRPYSCWDVLHQKLQREESVNMVVAPDSMRVIRWIPKTAKLYDIEGAISVSSISAGAGRAEVVLRPGPNTRFIVRSTPKRVLVNGEHSNHGTREHCSPEYCTVAFRELPASEHHITLIRNPPSTLCL